MVWLKFLLCLVIIFFAGTKAARYADVIAEKTGLGRVWIGLVLLAIMTSMPELITGVSSIALVKLPDLGLGTLLGSCIFNITVLAIIDILHRDGPVLNKASLRHIASAGAGILLIGIAAGSILAKGSFSGLVLGWVGIPSIIIFLLYLLVAWGLSRFERKHRLSSSTASPPQYDQDLTGRVWLKFALAATAVIATGVWLSYIGDEIAVATGWGISFVGSLLLAVITSVPELAVAIAALRLGAIDLAVADILGANMLDITYIFILDLIYTKGPLLSAVSSAHLITASVLGAMNLAIILALRFRQRRKTFVVISWYALLFIGLYIFGAYALFTSGIGLD